MAQIDWIIHDFCCKFFSILLSFAWDFKKWCGFFKKWCGFFKKWCGFFKKEWCHSRSRPVAECGCFVLCPSGQQIKLRAVGRKNCGQLSCLHNTACMEIEEGRCSVWIMHRKEGRGKWDDCSGDSFPFFLLSFVLRFPWLLSFAFRVRPGLTWQLKGLACQAVWCAKTGRHPDAAINMACSLGCPCNSTPRLLLLFDSPFMLAGLLTFLLVMERADKKTFMVIDCPFCRKTRRKNVVHKKITLQCLNDWWIVQH